MPRSTKRPRIIGPFFLIAILLSAGIFYWQKHRNEQALSVAPPPVVERQVIDTDTEIAPSPEIVTAHARELRLTAAQSKRVEPLVKAYQAELKPLQAQVQEATTRFQAYQQSRAQARQVPMAELQEQMGEVSQLSSRMLSLRRQYWAQIAPILSKEQQRQARELWAQSLKLKAPSPTRSQSS